MRPLSMLDRRVIHTDEVYNYIKEIHEQLLHIERNKTWNEI